MVGEEVGGRSDPQEANDAKLPLAVLKEMASLLGFTLANKKGVPAEAARGAGQVSFPSF